MTFRPAVYLLPLALLLATTDGLAADNYPEPVGVPIANVRFVVKADNKQRDINFLICETRCYRDGWRIANRSGGWGKIKPRKGSRYPQPIDNDHPVDVAIRADQAFIFQLNGLGGSFCGQTLRFQPIQDASYEVTFTDDGKSCGFHVEQVITQADGTTTRQDVPDVCNIDMPGACRDASPTP